MKILSFQPYSLYRNGGGSRVLRRLFDGHESEVRSLVLEENNSQSLEGFIREITVLAFPVKRSWMRWKMRDLISFFRVNIFKRITIKRIKRAADDIDYDILHIVNHGEFSTALCEEGRKEKRPIWVSFHDHFSTCSPIKDTEYLWKLAARRFVISKELGDEYVKVFGNYKFEVVTDGVLSSEVSEPIQDTLTSVIDIYFAGLLHIDYIPLVVALADTLDFLVQNHGLTFRLVLRGAQVLDTLENRSFIVDYRSNFISDEEVKKELDEATILYLPIKFNLPEFYLYSLSTKMVSYLGGRGAILYHGPGDSAACRLLSRNNAAVCCTTLAVDDIAEGILSLLKSPRKVSENAKVLAKNQFDLSEIQSLIWQYK